jgi:hypothetical protein
MPTIPTQITFKFLIFWGIAMLPLISHSQSLSLNLPVFEDYMRRQQLLGNLDSASSFMIRPLYPTQAFDTKGGDLDKTFMDEGTSRFNFFLPDKKGRVEVLPVMLRGQYNSDYAFGINNGPMIPNSGMQYLFSAGVYLEYGPLSVQLQPADAFR